MHPAFRQLLCGLGFSLLCGSASGVTLDWDTAAWTNGQTTNSYNIDPASTGNDVTVTVTGNGGATFASDITTSPQIQTPAVAKVFQGGLGSIENTLVVGLDLTSNAQSITVTVDFSAQYTAGILNLTFKIFDVDYSGSYQDILTNMRGLSSDGTTWIAPASITSSASNVLAGSGLAQTVTGTASVADTGSGATSNAGNVTISFGAAVGIKKFEFTYGSGPLYANPTFQHVGFYDFTYTPVPEINPAWSALISCIAVSGLVLRHRSLFRKK